MDDIGMHNMVLIPSLHASFKNNLGYPQNLGQQSFLPLLPFLSSFLLFPS
uniref:Uncharacterized protein n=1 Tax=Arundo donax TaxID=35708 RepID=A0A0A9BKW8_ARUDO